MYKWPFHCRTARKKEDNNNTNTVERQHRSAQGFRKNKNINI